MKKIKPDLFNKALFGKFFRFGLIGLLNTLVGYGCFYLFLTLKIHYLIAYTLAHIIGTIHSFLWNKYWTFQSKGKLRKELFRFFLIYLSTYLVNLFCLYILVKLFSWNPRIAQALVLFVLTVLSFFGHFLFSFRTSPITGKKS